MNERIVPGLRVGLSPALDLWVQGWRFGKVLRTDRTAAMVRLDNMRERSSIDVAISTEYLFIEPYALGSQLLAVYNGATNDSRINGHQVDIAKCQAMAYVWGVQDAAGSEHVRRYLNDDWMFSTLYGLHEIQYRLGEIGSRHSIRDAYKQYIEFGSIAGIDPIYWVESYAVKELANAGR